jgi:hypothetical protein
MIDGIIDLGEGADLPQLGDFVSLGTDLVPWDSENHEDEVSHHLYRA